MNSEPQTESSVVIRASTTLSFLDQLVHDSRIGKNKHFTAAERAKWSHYWLGVPAVIINVALGSVFVSSVLAPETQRWAFPLLAFIAASLGTIQTLFNFAKASEGHRSIGNRYLAIARKALLVRSTYLDGIVTADELCSATRSLLEEYSRTNSEAESFPTLERDYRRALEKVENKAPVISTARGGPTLTFESTQGNAVDA